MKILILTQAVDDRDTTLGFFCRWITKLAGRFEQVTVICLRQGSYTLPANVTVYCLHDYAGASKAHIAGRFLRLIWELRSQYDTVFVHMNQEYVLLGGILWHMLGKKIFFWRNHRMGDWKTMLAVDLSDKVLYTSTDSFTAHFSKSMIMPAGIDTELFEKNTGIERVKASLLMFGRIAPVKKVEMAINMMSQLKTKYPEVTMSIVGDALPKDKGYLQSLRDMAEALGVSAQVSFAAGVPFAEAPHVYHAHEIFLNFTPSGSFDKTIIEALAAGCKVVVANESMRDILPNGLDWGSWTNGESTDAAVKVAQLLMLDDEAEKAYRREAAETVKRHSLEGLMEKLVREMTTASR